MSTESPSGTVLPTYPRPHTSTRLHSWRSRTGETLTLRLAARRTTAVLRRVTLDCTGLMPAIELHVETDAGALVVSPAEVVS